MKAVDLTLAPRRAFTGRTIHGRRYGEKQTAGWPERTVWTAGRTVWTKGRPNRSGRPAEQPTVRSAESPEKGWPGPERRRRQPRSASRFLVERSAELTGPGSIAGTFLFLMQQPQLLFGGFDFLNQGFNLLRG